MVLLYLNLNCVVFVLVLVSLIQSLPDSENLNVENEIKSIEKVWHKFDNYIQLRENLLEKTYKKYNPKLLECPYYYCCCLFISIINFSPDMKIYNF